ADVACPLPRPLGCRRTGNVGGGGLGVLRAFSAGVLAVADTRRRRSGLPGTPFPFPLITKPDKWQLAFIIPILYY
ncbi:hypothetical protein, partial [Enterococcus rotai]|uniref:hypothetical protein n=1 Tax=Enterococcus rotai TaxID=118060 RepID=UPI0035C6831D